MNSKRKWPGRVLNDIAPFSSANSVKRPAWMRNGARDAIVSAKLRRTID